MAVRRQQWQAPLGLAAWGDSDDEEVDPGYFCTNRSLWITTTRQSAEGTSTNNDNIVGLLDADVVVCVNEVVNVKKEKRIRGRIASAQHGFGWISLKDTLSEEWFVERATAAQVRPPPPAPAPVVRTREVRQPAPVLAPPPPAPKPAPPPEPEQVAAELPVMKNSLLLKRRGSARFSDDVSDHTFACGLRWRCRENPVDVDISVLKFKKDGKYFGAVYFVDKDDVKNGIHHTGDEVSGMMDEDAPGDQQADSERILFKTSSFQPSLDVLLVVATIFSAGVTAFEEVADFSCHVVDTTDNKELCRYTKSDIGEGNAVVVAMIYRRGKRWAFKAIDESFMIPEHGTARTLANRGELAKYVREAKLEHEDAMRLEAASSW